jgi:hypothetical protein
MYQHRQIHVWISESDYFLLREQAEVTRESVSALIRRMIKNERQRLKVADSIQIKSAIVSTGDADEMIASLAS